MLRDFRFGARMLRKQPGFTDLAVLTLALGIGATSAVFSLIQGVLLSPPPYREPDKLVLVDSARTDRATPADARGWAPLQWMGWQKEARSLESVAAYAWTFNFLVLDDGSESLQGMPVTSGYFRAHGPATRPGTHLYRIGRTSRLGARGHHRLRSLAAEVQRRSAIVGKPMRMSRVQTPPTIIGVMPPGVRFLPTPGAPKSPTTT